MGRRGCGDWHAAVDGADFERRLVRVTGILAQAIDRVGAVGGLEALSMLCWYKLRDSRPKASTTKGQFSDDMDRVCWS